MCSFVKWFERSLPLKIDQVTMSEVVEVSEKAAGSVIVYTKNMNENEEDLNSRCACSSNHTKKPSIIFFCCSTSIEFVRGKTNSPKVH